MVVAQAYRSLPPMVSSAHTMRQRCSSHFRASMTWTVGDGHTYLFWQDHYVDGASIAKVAPLIFDLVPWRMRKARTINDFPLNRTWIKDIRGALGPLALVQYAHLWRWLRQFNLAEYLAVDHFWCLHDWFLLPCLVQRSTSMPHWRLYRRSWVPLKRCWTVDHLACHGLQHPRLCVRCDQASETMSHLWIGCSFA